MTELQVFIENSEIKGFLASAEGLALNRYALTVKELGPCLEIGSYCGLSSVYIAWACRDTQNVLFAVDHHRGSEEHQFGEEYHDASLYDAQDQRMNSFPSFQNTIDRANLRNYVIPIVCSSQQLAPHWETPLGFVFIDGGHSHESAMHDCLAWSKKLAVGGVLAVHDLFPSPQDGGQGPWLAFQKVLETESFEKIDQVESLGILKKVR